MFDCVVSVDAAGMLEYWSGAANDFEFPKNVHFESKLDTDLYTFAKVHANRFGAAGLGGGGPYIAMSTGFL